MVQPISKAILAQKYAVSPSTMNRLLNVHYYDDLASVGYKKSMRILPPVIIRKFIEIYGEPITEI